MGEIPSSSEFPSNSNRSKRNELEEVRRDPTNEAGPEQVIEKGRVTRRKPSRRKRLGSMLFADNASGITDYVVSEVLLPAARDMFLEAFNTGLERLFYGDARPANRRSRSGNTTHVSYNNYSKNTRREDSRMSRRGRMTHDFDEIVFEKRSEALDVLDMMDKHVGKYGYVRVADLYDMVGEESDFQDERWGWIDLDGVSVVRDRAGGYVLTLDKPEYLK